MKVTLQVSLMNMEMEKLKQILVELNTFILPLAVQMISQQYLQEVLLPQHGSIAMLLPVRLSTILIT